MKPHSKKLSLLPVLMTGVGLMLAVPSVVQAQFTYTITNGTITITGYSGPGVAVTIPAVINGLPVTTIGSYAFEYSGQTSVTIPSSVTSIGDDALGNRSLTTISVDTQNSFFSTVNGVLFDKNQTTLLEYPEALSGGYTIPASVTSIGTNAFKYSGLTRVTIPNSVTNIGNGAFTFCRSLSSVTIPDSVASIGDNAFYNCIGLSSVTIPGSVANLGNAVFEQCYSLASVTIPGSVSRVGDYAFAYCTNLTSLAMSNGVSNIGDSAFYYCTALAKVTIPGSVTNIENSAFEACDSLTTISVDTQNSFFSSVNGVLFDKSQTTLLKYPEGLSGGYMIPASVTSIGDSAFEYSGLKSVTIPNSVTNIGGAAFYGCVGLTNVTIPNSVTSIEDFAFDGSSLTSITIPDSVTSIGDWVFVTNLTAITVDTNNPAYSSLDGVLFDKSQTTLLKYPEGLSGGYTIPTSVTSIGNSAFYECVGLTNVTIPNSVTGIGPYAFVNCSSLTSITIPGSVVSIDLAAFGGCSGLASVYFTGNAPTLGLFGQFDSDTNATIYYLPGTMGWSTNFAGLPTALWLPQIQLSDASFGVRTNQFGFNINWASGMTVVVEASTSLIHPTWSAVATHTLTGGSSYFSDPQWTNYPSRFYRIRSP
jgi:hypothetical protein